MTASGLPRASSGEPRIAFSVDEAAELLGVGRTLIKDLLRTGQLKSRKAGRRRLISRQAIEEFMRTGDAA